MQWLEEGVAPQVVFEILSPGNRNQEMTRKTLCYEHFGANEYYQYDPIRTGFPAGDGKVRTWSKSLS